jgi:hypothetical protein
VISLGRRAGIFQVAHSNDAAIRLYLGGQPGAKLKEYSIRSEAAAAGAWTGPVAGATAMAKRLVESTTHRILGVSGVSVVLIPPLTRRKEGSLCIQVASAGRENTPRTPKPPRERRLINARRAPVPA